MPVDRTIGRKPCGADEEKSRIRRRRGAFWPQPSSILPRRGWRARARSKSPTAAHANKAMLYYYFGDKRHLHRAVLENLFRQLRNGVYQPQRKQASPRERLREFITAYFDFLASHPNYPRLVHREAMESTKEFDWIVRQYLRPFHNQLVRTLEEGIGGGGISRRGSASHGVHDHGHDHFLFRGCGDFQPGGGAQSAGAARAGGAQTGAAGFSGSWIDSNKSEGPMTGRKFATFLLVIFTIAAVAYYFTHAARNGYPTDRGGGRQRSDREPADDRAHHQAECG